MKQTELEGKESQSVDQVSAPDKETKPKNRFPDPDVPIEISGGPTDTGGGGHTGSPPKEREI